MDRRMSTLTYREAWQRANAALTPLPYANAAEEVRLILAHLLGCALRDLPLHQDKAVDEAALTALLTRRAQGEPLQYILGETEFMGLPYRCDRRALIPRGDTERLVEAALTRLEPLAAPKVADIGCGSGAIAVAVAHYCPQADVWAADISAEALSLTRENAQLNKVTITTCCGDLCEPLYAAAPFDMVISNPPYISICEMEQLVDASVQDYEPRLALTDEGDGLLYYRRLAQEARALVRDGGWLALEHGHTQSLAVQTLLVDAGWRITEVIRDWGGHDRAVIAEKQ